MDVMLFFFQYKSILLLSISIILIDSIENSLSVLEIHIMLEMFDITYLFLYDDPFYPPRIICCPNFFRSIKDYSPRAVSHGCHAIFFSVQKYFVLIDLNYPNWFHWKFPFGSRNPHYAGDVWYHVPFLVWWPVLPTHNYLLPQFFPITKRLFTQSRE